MGGAMDIGQTCREAGFWGLDRLRHSVIRRHLADIEALANKPDRREEILNERLRAFLAHATTTTSHYARFQGAQRLEDFPVLQKAQIREDYDGFRSRAFAPEELTSTSTSGSYGTPLVFPLSRDKRARQLAELLYFTGWIGWKVGMRYLQVRARNPSRLQRFLHNEEVVDPTHMTAEWYRHGRALLRDSGIRFLMGYPSAIHALAEYCRGQGDDPHSFRILGACLGGETLTPSARGLMEETFGCPVRSRYAANELGVIAQEPLDEPGRHVLNACSQRHEVLRLDCDDPAPVGQLGRLVVTDLYSHALPLIRYDTGDLGALSVRPDSGSGLPVLERLEGRQTDVIFDAEGNRMSNLRLFDAFGGIDGLIRFQLVQVGFGRYNVCCVALPGFDQEARVGERARAVLGPTARISVERVPDIPPLASGKRPAILNRVAPPTGARIHPSGKPRFKAPRPSPRIVRRSLSAGRASTGGAAAIGRFP